MCRFVKCCVSFVLALALSFVSLVPCFANVVAAEDTTVNTDGTVCSVGIGEYLYPGELWDYFLAPTSSFNICASGYSVDSAVSGLCPFFETTSQFLFEQDRTLYWNIYPVIGSDMNSTPVSSKTSNLSSNSASFLPRFVVGIGYLDSGESTQVVEPSVTRVALGNENFQGVYSNTYRVTIPSKSPNGNYNNNFGCYYPSGATADSGLWSSKNTSSGSVYYVVDMFQFVDTADSGILAVLDKILAEAEEANLNLSNILSACNEIIVQLDSMGADVEIIREMMATLAALSQTQINILGNIDTNVSAIYYFLTQELKSESEELSGEAAQIGSGIDNNHAAEQYYQTSMQGSYDSLDLENFSFGGIAGALELVGTVFSDIWAAFGSYTIIFTFPLVLGICLLAIGRISRYDTQKRREATHQRRVNEIREARKGK